DPAGAGLVRGAGDGERVGAVALVAVEEVLAVDHRLAAGLAYGPDGLGDRLEVLLVADAEGDAHVIVPRLRHEADGSGARLKYRLETRIVRYGPAGALGHVECGEPGRFQLRLIGEKRRIGRVGAWIAALDVIDAEPVQQLRNAPLVLQREIHPRRLRAIAQRRVEEIQAFA